MPIDCRGVMYTLTREGRVACFKLSRHFFFQPCTCFHRTTVIYRAQLCNTVISHSLVPERQTQDAGRAIRAMFWVQAAGCIVRSSAAIFRLSLAIKMCVKKCSWKHNYHVLLIVIHIDTYKHWYYNSRCNWYYSEDSEAYRYWYPYKWIKVIGHEDQCFPAEAGPCLSSSQWWLLMNSFYF